MIFKQKALAVARAFEYFWQIDQSIAIFFVGIGEKTQYTCQTEF